MTKTQDIFEQAAALLQVKPQPQNIVEILDEMRRQIPEEAREYFDDFYEAATAAQGVTDG